MAIPSTSTLDPLFSSQQPAWEYGVELTQGHATRLFTTRAGMEQRQQSRLRSQWRMLYTIHLDGDSLATRDARNRAEIAAAVVVPFWPERAIVAAMVSNSVTISRTATEDWFAVGDYVYLYDPDLDVGQFRVVAGYGVSLQQLTLEPHGTELIFAAGTQAFPCRLCVRDGGRAEHEDQNSFAVQEEVAYVTL